MAVLAAAQLLDELMGRNRNVAPHEKVKELNWEDPEVRSSIFSQKILLPTVISNFSTANTSW